MKSKNKFMLFFLVLCFSLCFGLRTLKAETNYEINETFDDNSFLNLLNYDSDNTRARVNVQDGKLVNTFDGSSQYTKIWFGGQDKGEFGTLAFDFTPVYNNSEFAILNFNFRRWDDSSVYKFEVTDHSMKLIRYTWGNKEVVLDSVDYGFLNNETVRVKIYTNGWYKAIFVNDEKLLETSEGELSTGFYGIESWESGYVIDNLTLTYDKDDTDLNSLSLKRLKEQVLVDFAGLYDVKDFSDENKAQLETLKANLETEIKDLRKASLVNAAYEAKEKEAQKVITKQLEVTKTTYLAKVNTYVDLNNYSGENKTAMSALITKYQNLISEATKFSTVYSNYEAFVKEANAIKSNDDLDSKALEAKINESKETIRAYVNLDKYSSENQKVIAAIFTEFDTKVVTLETIKAVENLVTEYQAKIDLVKTLEAEEKEELDLYKEEAIKEIEGYLDNGKIYSVRAKKELEKIIKSYKSLINMANKLSVVESRLAAAKKALDAVITADVEYKDGLEESFENWDFVDNSIALRSAEDFDIIGNSLRQLRQAEVNETRIMFGGASIWEDFTLELDLKPNYLNTDYSWGKIHFRAQSNTGNDSYVFNYKNNISWLSIMDKDGKENMLDSVNFGFEDLISYHVKIVSKGNKIMVIANDEKILEATDDTYKVGHFGFITWQTGYIIKNLTVSHTVKTEDLTLARKSFKTNFDFEDGKLTDVLASRGINVVTDPFNENNKVLANKQFQYTKALLGDACYKNFKLNLEVIPTGLDAPEQLLKFIIRSNGWEGNSYYFELTKFNVSVFSNSNEKKKELGSFPFEFIGTARYQFEIRALDGRIAFYIQGNKVLDVVDSSFDTYGSAFLEMGYTGIQTWNCPYYLDNYQITPITSWGEEPKASEYPKAQIVLAETLDIQNKDLTLKVGNEGKLEVLCGPSNANTKITYTSSDENVVTVNEKGEYKVVGTGKATITVKEMNSNLEVVVNINVPAKKKGCSGSLSISLMGSLALICGGLVILKKKKED